MHRLKGKILLEHVSFSYGNGQNEQNKSVGYLDDISLRIKAGEKIAIVGESGCGKSTLLKIMMGMLRPQKGLIMIVDNSQESGQ